jgi:MFS superfamily sulfate permease-like transporter
MVPTMSPMMVLVAVLSAASVMMLQLALMLALEETLAALTAASVVVSMLETSVLTTVVVTVVSLLTPMTRLRRGKCSREHCSRLDLPFPRPHHKSASSASFARHALTTVPLQNQTRCQGFRYVVTIYELKKLRHGGLASCF